LPHCILEYSENIQDAPNWTSLFHELHQVLLNTGEFNEQDIKSRAIGHKNYFIGNGNPDQAFIALNVQILDGRTDEFKKDLAQSALNILNKFFCNTLKKLQATITVQISDIHRASYGKSIS